MVEKWKGTTSEASPKSRGKEVAIYKGVVRIASVRSLLKISRDVPRDRVIRAIGKRPEWMLYDWPDMTPETDEELVRLAALKLLTIFDFGRKLDGSTSAEIHAALERQNPGLRALRSVQAATEPLFSVDAAVYESGYFRGGFRTVGDTRALPLAKITADTVDLYVKNVVAADILRTLEIFGHPAKRRT